MRFESWYSSSGSDNFPNWAITTAHKTTNFEFRKIPSLRFLVTFEMNSWVSALCWLWSLTWSCLWWLFLALINPHKSNMSVYFEWLLNRYSHTLTHTLSAFKSLSLGQVKEREEVREWERERYVWVCARERERESKRVLNQEPIFEWWSLNFLIRRCVSKNRNVSWNISFFFFSSSASHHFGLWLHKTDRSIKNLDHVGGSIGQHVRYCNMRVVGSDPSALDGKWKDDENK